MEVVASTAFGLDIDVSKENHEFARNAEKMFQFTFASPWFLVACNAPLFHIWLVACYAELFNEMVACL